MSATPKRVAISLAPSERDALHQLAHQAGEPVATTAGRLVRAALADHGATLDTPPARRAGPSRTSCATCPTTDTFVAEQANALVGWRTRLDAAGTDANPVEILDYGYQLRTFALLLQDRARRGR